jgi:hypothetical protein
MYKNSALEAFVSTQKKSIVLAMMPLLRESEIDDAICVWLDEVIPLLEHLECLKWPHHREITLPEAFRASLFFGAKKAIQGGSFTGPRRKAMKFPSSVISRVQNAISHLSQYPSAEVRLRSVVFLPMSLAELAHQIPVAHELSEIEKSYCFVFQSPKWADQLQLDNVDVLEHSKAFQSQLLCARLRARVMWLRLGREGSLALPKLRFAGKEFDLNDVVLDTFLDFVTAAFEGHALAKYLVDYVRPQLIVVSDELHPQRRVIVACAKRYGIRCVDLMSHVQDGPIDAYRMCDRFVVFGNYAKRALAASGIDTKKIKACGAPYLDALALQKPLAFLTRDPNEQGTGSRFVIADVDDKWAAALNRFAQQQPKTFFLFLTQKAGDLYQRYLKQTRNFRICQKSELSSAKYASCLKSADLILTDKMKSALEAMSLGKNVVALDFDGAFDDREFIKASVVATARDAYELTRVLASEQSQVGESGRQYLEDYFYRKDGGSSGRIASVIVEELQK